MKLQLALATALLAISATSVQAGDTRTPEILASVSTGSVQSLSKADAKNIRGEYRYCTAGPSEINYNSCGYYSFSFSTPPEISGKYIDYMVNLPGFHVSR